MLNIVDTLTEALEKKLTISDIRRNLPNNTKSSYDESRTVLYNTKGLFAPIVVDNTLKILAQMPPPIQQWNHLNRKKLESLIVNNYYNIYKINDGTIVTLYYLKDRWVLCTAKSYEIDNTKWNIGFTFRESFEECIPDKKFWGNLNTNYCYSFGFNHPAHHPFQPYAKSKFMWFVQKVDLKTMKIAYDLEDEQLQIPGHTEIVQSVLKPTTLKQLLDNACAQHMQDAAPYKECPKDYNFGYILRAKEPAGDVYDNVLIEGLLLYRLRNLYYNSSYHIDAKKHNYVPHSYIMVFLYAHKHLLGQFLILCPQYVAFFAAYDKRIDLLAEEIMKIANAKNNDSDEKTGSVSHAKRVYNNIITIAKPTDVNIVKAVLLHDVNINILYELLPKE